MKGILGVACLLFTQKQPEHDEECSGCLLAWGFAKVSESLIAGGKDWQTARAESKLGFQVMVEILQAKRQAEGKATKHYHFSNEALLCNAALTGQFRPIERDKLNKAALTMLIRLEARNSALIGQGLPYEERKAQLFAMAAPRRAAFQTALTAGTA